MIPETGWSDDTQLKEYATYGIAKPQYSSDNPFKLELGPEQLNTSGGNIKAAWWLFEFNGSEVTASKYNGNDFELGSVVFSVTNIKRLSATFDQLGRPMVFYETNSNELKLFWFDPVLVQNIITEFGVGNYPFATFDIRWDTSNPRSDVMLFYMRSGAIYYRMQRDRYSIEYATPVVADAVFIKEADMAVDYHLQLLYRYIDTGYNPPQPVQPEIPPVVGSFGYKLSGYQSAIETRRTNMFTLGKDNSIAFYLDEIDFDKPEIALFSQNQDPNAGAFALSFTGSRYTAVRVAYGRTEYISTAPFPLQAGHWIIDVIDAHSTGKFDTLRLRCKPLGAEEYLTHSIDVRASAMRTEITAQFLIGAVSGYVGNLLYCLRAVIRDIQINATALNEHGLIDQNLPVELLKLPMIKSQAGSQLFVNSMDVPVLMNSAIIKDYRAANWVFIEG
ncbi:hypothetical protein L5M28_07500 [Shewanella sp. SW32]|uniref:hypothetical protein n=1 Tax=unclassified Shewanella TaxID=196818 RepID=UPI0021DAC9BB|nr:MULTISPECIES: hypothetical protein [unclassified Shewanella]MCU7962423.1 hypothetical protein [Shewanella sp. SW32]MCU7969235.1 hypothetical protein [Shewanella sp. SW29]